MDKKTPLFAHGRVATAARRRLGFGVAPILYMLGLIGVGAGVLFSGYSQSLKNNINMTNSFSVKSDLDAAATTLAATSVLGASDNSVLCPPQGGAAAVGSNCANAPTRMTDFYPNSNVTPGDAHLPSGYAAAPTGGSPVEAGIFTPAAGVKQIDPWGHYYIVCRWESAANSTSSPAFEIISAGPDGILQTRCGATVAAGDDQIISMNAANAVNRSAVWQVGTVGTSTPEVHYGTTGHQLSIDANGNLTVPGDIIVGGSYSSGGGNITLAAGSFVGNLVGGSVTGSTAAFAGGLAAEDSAFTVGTGGSITASNGAFSVNSGGGINAAAGAFNVSTAGDLTVGLGTAGLSVSAATGNTILGGTLSIGSTTTTLGAVHIGTTTPLSGTVIPLLTVGKPIGTNYPFYVDQNGDVLATGGGSQISGSFSGSANGTFSGSVTATSLPSVTGAIGGWNTTGNITTAGTITATSFVGNLNGSLNLGGGGSISGVVPIANGGTGASNAATALANLGVTSSGYLNTALLEMNMIPGADLVNNSVTSNQLNTTGVVAGSYNWGTVGADGRITFAEDVPVTSNGITDGSGGDSVIVGTSSITFTVAGVQQGIWTTTGLGIGTSAAGTKLDVNGNIRIEYAAGTSTPNQLQLMNGASSQRWAVTTDGIAEGAGNSGSDLVLKAYDNSGSAIGTSALTLTRGGNATFGGTVTASSFSGSIGAGSINSGTLGVAYGGTGTSTQFTPGSIVFAGTNGVYTQDNGNFFWDDGNVRLGIGTATPGSGIQIYNGEVQVGSSGLACSSSNAGALRFSGGTMYYCDGVNPWTSLASASNGNVDVNLGTSSAATNPQRASEPGTGLYTANTGLVDVAAGGAQIAEFSSGGVNIATGGLKIGGLNGVSYPASDSTAGGSIAVGAGALSAETSLASTAFGNTAVGYQAIGGSLTVAAVENTAVGYRALLANTSGASNTATGYASLYANGAGSYNTATGMYALVANTSGSNNTATGYAALDANVTGANNTAQGYQSMLATLGSSNTAVGFQSLYANTSGSSNTAIGYQTGHTNLTTGSNNILIGAGADTPNSGTSYWLNIGNSLFGDLSTNRVAIGPGVTGVTAGAALDLSANTTTANSSLLLPGGVDATRPTGANGMIRYNPNYGVEAFVNGSWTTLINSGSSGASSGITPVVNGGTGDSSLTQHGVLIGEGTAAVDVTAAGTTGTVLIGNSNADPSFSSSVALTNLTLSGAEALTFATDYTASGLISDAAVSTSSAVRYNGSAAATFYGIVAGTAGQILELHNASNYTLTLANQSANEATAANKIITGLGSDLIMLSNSSVTLQYDASAGSPRWRVIGGSGGGIPAGTTGQVQFNSGSNTFAASSNLFWDNTNFRLGIGSATPGYALDVATGTVAGTIMHVNSAGVSINTIATGVTPNIATTGQMAYYSSTNAISGTPNLYVSGTNIGIGTSTATNLLSLNGASAQTIWMERSTAAGFGLKLQAGGGLSGGSNENGGTLTLAGGISTGTGTSTIQFQTYPGVATGTSDNSPTTAMTILGSGLVGIGSATPTSKFVVYGNSTGLSMDPSNGSTIFGTLGFNRDTLGGTLYSNSAYGYQLSNYSNRLQFEVYNTSGTQVTSDALTIGSSGNIGIGTSTPNQALTINTGGTQSLAITATSGNQYILMGNQNASGANNPAMIQASNGALSFGHGSSWTDPVGGTYTQNVTFANGGSVGIGTTTMTGLLNVNGTTSTALPFYFDGLGEAYSTSTASAKYAYFPAGTLGEVAAGANSVNSGALIDFNAYNSSNNASDVYIGAVAGSTANYTGNFVIGRRTGTSSWAESLRVDTNGNVGIGTTSPAYVLDVVTGSSTVPLEVNNGFNTITGVAHFSTGRPTVEGTTEYLNVNVGSYNNGATCSGCSGYTSLTFGALTNAAVAATGSIGYSAVENSNPATGYLWLSESSVFGKTATGIPTGATMVLKGGNVGIGTTSPSTALQLGPVTALQTVVSTQSLFGNNIYYSGGQTGGGNWTYITSGAAASIRMSDVAAGAISFHTSPSGTAGATDSTMDTTDIKVVITNAGQLVVGSSTAWPWASYERGIDFGYASAGTTEGAITSRGGQLGIERNAYINGSGTQIYKYNGSAQFIDMEDDANGASPFLAYEFATNGTAGNTVNFAPGFVVNSTGFGIGTGSPDMALSVVGNADKSTGGTAWSVYSDRRLKDIDGEYEHGLAEIAQLNPIKFHYKKDNARHLPSDNAEVGLIAQEVQKIFPEAVSEAKDGYLQLNVSPIQFAVINAIKQLKALFDLDHGLLAKLQALFDTDHAAIAQLKADNDNLKAANDNAMQAIGQLRKEFEDYKKAHP